jgi:hypothetical protein
MTFKTVKVVLELNEWQQSQDTLQEFSPKFKLGYSASNFYGLTTTSGGTSSTQEYQMPKYNASTQTATIYPSNQRKYIAKIDATHAIEMAYGTYLCRQNNSIS